MNKKLLTTLVVVILAAAVFFIDLKIGAERDDFGFVSNQGGPSLPAYTEQGDDLGDSQIYQYLTSHVWVWKETHKGTGPDSASGGKIVPQKPGVFTLTFKSDGQIIGTTDCNNFTGTYTIVGGQIDFSPFASTLKFCDKSQESEFMAMIKKGLLGYGGESLFIEHAQTIIFDKGKSMQ